MNSLGPIRMDGYMLYRPVSGCGFGLRWSMRQALESGWVPARFEASKRQQLPILT